MVYYLGVSLVEIKYWWSFSNTRKIKKATWKKTKATDYAYPLYQKSLSLSLSLSLNGGNTSSNDRIFGTKLVF